jgi:hypothetical protein
LSISVHPSINGQPKYSGGKTGASNEAFSIGIDAEKTGMASHEPNNISINKIVT